VVIPTGVPLLVSVLALVLAALGTTSQLPATVPGLSHDEGVFLVTSADDGSRLIYFVAGDARHAIQDADVQAEMRLNPLWPVREVGRDAVLAHSEGAPIGAARAGVLDAPSAPATVTEAEVVEVVVPQPVAEVAPAPVPEATAAVPAAQEAAEPTTWTVQRGDSAIGIARATGVEVDDLLAVNAIANRDRIYVGQVLTIPGQTS